MSKHEEFRVFGPPGTGKTTYLSHRIQDAVAKHGGEAVLIASFTKAAAAELVTRGMNVPDSAIATLHAHCYRLLGRPALAESAEGRAIWNKHIDTIDPALRLSGAAAVNADDHYADEATGETEGDAMLSTYNVYRARMIDRDSIEREDARRFVGYWEQWKADEGSVDFTDMLSFAHDMERFPLDAQIGFFDECQDNSPLEMAVIRKWAKQLRFVVMAGDDDQCLYQFKGASAEAFLTPPVDKEHKRFLRQSWRVPAAVHAMALRWVKLLSHREKKKYLPRDQRGSVRLLSSSMGNGVGISQLIDDVESRLEAPNDQGDARRVMILASCSYQLRGVLSEMRRRGMLFHNPYRKSRFDWNPLGSKGTAQRVRAFLSPAKRNEWPEAQTDAMARTIIERAENRAYVGEVMRENLWSKAEFDGWIELVKRSATLKRGGLQRVQKTPGHEDHPQFGGVFMDEFLDPVGFCLAAHGNLQWLRRYCKDDKVDAVDYLRQLVNRSGVGVLDSRPRVVVGTIHSVKGGEADTVYICPDLSLNGWEERLRDADPSIRMGYVAATRAREEVVLIAPYSNAAIDLWNFC